MYFLFKNINGRGKKSAEEDEVTKNEKERPLRQEERQESMESQSQE